MSSAWKEKFRRFEALFEGPEAICGRDEVLATNDVIGIPTGTMS